MILLSHDATLGSSYSSDNTSSSSKTRLLQDYQMAIQASFESQKPVQVPITIVTAASANHLCALEAFLYDLERMMSQAFSEDPDQKELRTVRRQIQNQWYLRTSDDLARLQPNYRRKRRKRPPRVPKKRTKKNKEEKGEEREGEAVVQSHVATVMSGVVAADASAPAAEKPESEQSSTVDGSGNNGSPVEQQQQQQQQLHPEAKQTNPDSEESFLFAERQDSVPLARRMLLSSSQQQQQQQQPQQQQHQQQYQQQHQQVRRAIEEPLLNRLGSLPVQYELRPRVVVYNLGMGVHKQKRRRFKALVEAGYMDEVYDFDFWRYPSFWSLGKEDELHSVTRGEYGWKAGIIEEVTTRILESLAMKNGGDINSIGGSGNDGGGGGGIGNVKDQRADAQREANSTASFDQQEQQDPAKLTEDSIEGLLGSGSSTPPAQPPIHVPHIVLWADSGDRFSPEFFRWLPSHVRRHGMWTPQSGDTMSKWTHPGMLAYYHASLSQFAEDETNCNGAVMAFDIKNSTVRNGILREWIRCARRKECIAPEGSSRENHRQDQAALTYLVKTMGYGEHQCRQFPRAFGVLTNLDHECKQDIANSPNRIMD